MTGGAKTSYAPKPLSIAPTPDGATQSLTVEVEIVRAQTTRRSGEMS